MNANRRPLYMLLGLASLLLLEARSAEAQRREGDEGLSKLEIRIKRPTKFGEQVLSRGAYRLGFNEGQLIVFDARTMVLAARLDVKESELPKAVTKPSAKVVETKKSTEIRVRYRDRSYLAEGVAASKKEARPARVDLAAAKGAVGITGGIPDEQSDREFVERALPRLEKDIAHCADQAQKQRWSTDHPRFKRCVCPLTDKWRLPQPKKDLRVHRVLAKGQSGYSITVTPAGKVADCRVWSGSKPPKDEKSSGQPEAQAKER